MDTGMRIGDILRLKRSVTKKGTFTVVEAKTKKKKACELSESTLKLLQAYMQSNPASGKHSLFINPRTHKPYTRQTIWKSFKVSSKRLNMRHIGTHSIRKTFAQDEYKRVGLEGLQNKLNHGSSKITAVYLKQVQLWHDFISWLKNVIKL
jgi:integrase